jgi:fructoselysine-6-P-deglycase FrlB-like protein
MSGRQMSAEMAEQPERLRDLIARTDGVHAAVQEVTPAPLHGVTLVARGSSDHAAVHGRYLLEQATCKPVSLAAPSLHTLYGVQGDYQGQLAIAISQSGRTPEIVTTLRRLCAAGARGLSVTNDGTSELARAGRPVLELGVGEKRARFSVRRGTRDGTEDQGDVLDPRRWSLLGRSPPRANRGGDARFSGDRDQRAGTHGRGVLDLVAELRRRAGRPLLILPDDEADIPLPQGMPETLAPIVAVVRGQQVARALALALELDPDHPPGLSKVTVT